MIHQTQAETQQNDRQAPVHDRVFDAEELLGAAHKVQIRLDNQIYTLRRTRFGKLLLTK